MSENHLSTIPDTLPEPQRTPPRRWLPGLVWLIPLIAAAVGLSLAAHAILSRGPEITLSFLSAEGLEAGKTRVKFKDVDIGTVQRIALSQDSRKVLVTVQLAREAEQFAAADSRFWVVRPRIDVGGVSGLNTLFSGAYIGVDAGHSTLRKTEFTGLETPPSVTRDRSGRQFVLHASDLGSLDIGSPVYYRRVRVGQVVGYNLDENGKGVTLHAFINAPYDRFVDGNTRFWHASGFDLKVDSNGVRLNTQALATVMLGGIAFQTPEDQGSTPPALENTDFALAADQDSALKAPDGSAAVAVLNFSQSLRGLVPGAPVDFRGVVIGQVLSLGVDYDAKRQEFRMPVVIQLYPDRLGSRFHDAQSHESESLKRQHFMALVARGLRAQLRTGNLLTGQLYVAIDFFPKAPPVKLDESRVPIELPTIPNSLDEIQVQLADITSKLSKVPFDKIGRDLHTTLNSLDATLKRSETLVGHLNDDVAPQMVAAMKDARSTLANANRLLSGDAPLQQDARRTLQDLSRAAVSLRVLTDYLERHPEALIRGKQEEKP
ncbi:intermembrane transport protein PqiB [Paludibacterium yongneupense]|uniref:PqiB family protein n=1 Tax=Paludibacterium yongneupense TaxID=400061 RepID=UPI00041C83D9|nr:MlaD family protein [Paludibacterium yongneupense]